MQDRIPSFFFRNCKKKNAEEQIKMRRTAKEERIEAAVLHLAKPYVNPALFFFLFFIMIYKLICNNFIIIKKKGKKKGKQGE
jgi:hypothetical protein